MPAPVQVSFTRPPAGRLTDALLTPPPLAEPLAEAELAEPLLELLEEELLEEDELLASAPYRTGLLCDGKGVTHGAVL